jgi:Uroporphyrinogen-III synthase
MTVLVVRESDVFSRILQENGFAVVNCPTIKTEPLEDLSDFQAKISSLEKYDGIFLTSRNAAEILRDGLRKSGVRFGGKVYVLGKRSFEILKDENLDLKFFETANRAEEMLAAIPSKDLEGGRFLFVRGEKSLRTIPEFLKKSGAITDETVVYRTVQIAVEDCKIKEISEILESGEVLCACFFSPSAAENFLRQFGAEKLHRTKIAAIGETTAGFLEKFNLRADFVAAKATAEDFALELSEYLKRIPPAKDAKKIFV